MTSVLVRPDGPPAGPRHRPGSSTECRACKSCQQDDLPVPATAQAGRRVPSGRLVNPLCTVTSQAGRQSAKRASPASWSTHRTRHRLGRAAKCRACKSSGRDDPPVPATTQARRRRPRGQLVEPPCTITTQAGWQSAKRARPASWMTCCSRHRLGRAAKWRACKSSGPDDPPVPVTTQDGGKVPSVQVWPAGRPYVPHHHQGGRQKAERTSQAR